MDLDDEEMEANRKKSQNEKIIDSLEKEIKFLESVIDFDDIDLCGYWEKEKYCLQILYKIKKGEISK